MPRSLSLGALAEARAKIFVVTILSADNAQSARLDLARPDDAQRALAVAAQALLAGGVVLLPTDTVYGLMCIPTRLEAVRAVYDMKQRPAQHRLPVIVENLDQALRELPMSWPPAGRALARAFWPGPVTIACGVLSSAEGWLAGRDEAAVRAPQHALVQTLARRLGPLLMTSANRHGSQTPHTLEAALADLAVAPTVAIDGGTLSGASSTLVNVNLPKPKIEREGAVDADSIARVLDAA